MTTTTTLPALLALAITACASLAGSSLSAAPRSSDVNLNDSAVAIDVRVKQAKALATDKNPKAVDILLTGLDSRSEPLRAAIIASLKAQKGDVVLLQRAADTKRPAADRAAALAGIRVIKPADGGPKLGLLLVDKEEQVREAAAHALCVVGTAAAEANLVAALKAESSAKVRYFLATALGELKTPAAKQAVTTQLKTEADFATKDALEQSQAKQNRPL